jgi:hypothetical protein
MKIVVKIPQSPSSWPSHYWGKTVEVEVVSVRVDGSDWQLGYGAPGELASELPPKTKSPATGGFAEFFGKAPKKIVAEF